MQNGVQYRRLGTVIVFMRRETVRDHSTGTAYAERNSQGSLNRDCLCREKQSGITQQGLLMQRETVRDHSTGNAYAERNSQGSLNRDCLFWLLQLKFCDYLALQMWAYVYELVIVFMVLAQRRTVVWHRRFGELCCLHLHGDGYAGRNLATLEMEEARFPETSVVTPQS